MPNIESLIQEVVRHFGRLDIVVSNSGMEKFKPLEETTLEDFNEVFNLNTRAQMFVARYAYDHIQPGGRVILMSSIAAGLGVPGHALYAGSKAAIEGFTRCLAADPLKRCGVPEDIGKVVSFLASPDAEWVNGQIIPVNGGANI